MKRILRTEHWAHLQPFLPPRSGIRMLVLGGLAFVGGLAESGVLVIVAVVANTLISGSGNVTLWGLDFPPTAAVLFALLLVGMRMATTLASSVISSRLSANVMMNAQEALIRSYLVSSHEAKSARGTGDLSTVIVNHGRQTGDLANTYASVAAAICGLAAFGGMSLMVNPIATFGIATIGGVVLVLMRPLRSRSKQAARVFSGGSRDLGSEMTQVEALHREIDVFHVEDQILKSAGNQLWGNAQNFKRLRVLSGSIPPIFQSLMLGTAVLSMLVIVNAATGADLAAVGAVVLLLIRSTSSAQQLVNANQSVIEGGAYAREVIRLINRFRGAQRYFGRQRPDSLTPLVLKDVEFSYDDETNVLSDVSLELKAGELIGIVGPSGAGKSTLVELLLRLRQPTDGTISVGGTPIDEIDPQFFGRGVAFVPQQAVLITGTVAENVSFFREISEDQVRVALRSAHLEDEIDALPEGINTRLGPDERALSGGQQQRLTIARALAGDPEILILDEPTSALDAVSEAAIRETLSNLPPHCLAIIVAHRYSTLRSCSRILLIENGRIAADATPAEVAENSTFFQTMVGDSE